MIHSKVCKECVYKCCHNRLIACSTFFCHAVTTFLQLNLIVLNVYKKLVAALALLPSWTNRRVGHSSTELSGDRATSMYAEAPIDVFISKLQFMIFWAALVDREWPWATKNGRSIRTQLLEWGAWRTVQYTENLLWIYKLQNSSWHSFVSPGHSPRKVDSFDRLIQVMF